MRQNVASRRNHSSEHDRRGDRNRHSSSSNQNGNGNIPNGNYNDPGNVLIADTFNNRVIEANPRGEIVWQYGLGPNVLPTPAPIVPPPAPPAPQFGLPTVAPTGSIYGPTQVQRIGDLTLIAASGIPVDVIPAAQQAAFPLGIVDSRVIIVNEAKQIVFSYGQFGVPTTGRPLLTDVISAAFVPASLSNNQNRRRNQSSSSSSSSSRNRNNGQTGINHLTFEGTILIVDAGDATATPPVPPRVIEIDSAGNIVFQFPAAGTTLPATITAISGASRLSNGNTLIFTTNNAPPPGGPNGVILEVSPNGQIVRSITGTEIAGGAGTLSGLIGSAYLLDNGNLLVADSGNNRVVEINPVDQIVWQHITNAEYESIFASSPRSAVRLANGDTLIADTFNNRVIRVNDTGVIVAQYGLPLGVGDVIAPGAVINTNFGYSPFTTQLGLDGPSDAKIVGDYTGQLDPLLGNGGSSSNSSRR